MRRTDRRSDCPINFAVQIFGDPWSLLVVRDLMFTPRRTYSDFLRAEEGMATNILADRLAHLQEVGLIRKARMNRGAGYALTQKGLDLLPAMLDLIAWGAKYDECTGAPEAFVARIRNDRSRVESELRDLLRAEFGL